VATHRSARRVTALHRVATGVRRLAARGGDPGPTVTVGLSVLLAALLVTAGVLTTRVRHYQGEESRRQAVLAAARQTTISFTTLDYRRGDADLRRVLDGATGAFKQEFSNGSRQLRQLITQNQAVSKGQVLEAGLVAADADSARVLVVADSTVTNKSTPKGQRRHYRILLDLRREGGRWLTSNLEFVG
jgi:Mce-associated membrane protein